MNISRDDYLADLLGNYREWLHHEATRLIGAGNPDLDDLVQEGYISMWKAAGTYNPGRGALPAWLTLKARGRMLDILSRRTWTGRPRQPHDGSHPEPASLDAAYGEDGGTLEDLLEGPGITASAELAYHRGEIAAALDRLTPRQREYVTARFWHGMTGQEMAGEVFGYDPSALWNSRRNGARGKLAAELAHLNDVCSA